jgi:acyl carrier protein
VNFLELFNEVAKLAKPAVAATFEPVTDPDAPLKDCGIDSLDLLLITVYMCEIFGIPEEIGKELRPATVADIEVFIKQHGTKVPGSVKEAIESVS